jgi:malonyl-CoA O-methyltransferase
MPELLDPAAAYELWAPTYSAAAHNPLMLAEQAIVERIVASCRAGRALDVGTGSGRYVPILAGSARSVVGVDRSMSMLQQGAARTRLRADACSLPFVDGAFGLVNASLMAGDVRDLDGWIHEMARVLSPDGHLVYSDFHPSWTALGWQRTFKDVQGVQRAIRFEPHTIEGHLSALRAAGLAVLAIREPRLTVRGVSRRVLAIFHAVKPRIARKELERLAGRPG